VITSTQPTTGRLSSAERRAAQIASISTKQAELKQEAAERRAKQANNSGRAAPPPRKAGVARRSNSR
jgi:hypothetical protein